MHEVLSQETQIEEEKGEILLDRTLFDRIDKLLKEMPPSDDCELFKQILDSAKEKSFEYVEEVLDMILDNDKEEGIKSHNISGALANVDSMLRFFNIPNNWPLDYRKAHPLYKVAALDYVLRHALDYEKRALDGQEDKEKVLEEMKLTPIINAAYMEKHIIDKINNLPIGVRNNLLLVKKPQ